MKALLLSILLISQLVVFAANSMETDAAHDRAVSAAKTVGISPLWMYNKSTYEVRTQTAKVQAVMDRKQKMNDELLELCHSMQAAYNAEKDVVGCEM
jgi:hypothetical protein